MRLYGYISYADFAGLYNAINVYPTDEGETKAALRRCKPYIDLRVCADYIADKRLDEEELRGIAGMAARFEQYIPPGKTIFRYERDHIDPCPAVSALSGYIGHELRQTPEDASCLARHIVSFYQRGYETDDY